MMEKFTLKQKAEYFYLKAALEFEHCAEEIKEPVLDLLLYKKVILGALEQLHGQVGAAIIVDVLKYNQQTRQAILRVPESGVVKLWSALTLFGSYQDLRCAFHILQISPHLMALATNSREWRPMVEGVCR